VKGDLQRLGEPLSTDLGRHVVVPAELRGKSIQERNFTGVPEQVLEALGPRFR